MSTPFTATILGAPRIGPNRELKRAVERYWAGRIDRAGLESIAAQLRRETWQTLAAAGLDSIPVNTFSYYDHVLDTAVMLGALLMAIGHLVLGASEIAPTFLYLSLAIIVCADTNEVWTRKYDGKKIGEHGGAHFYTIGQRKGLGIGGRKESLFILATDTVQNVIYVGEGDSHPGLWRQALHIAPREIHWVNPARTMPAGHSARFSVRIRYRQPLQDATLFMRDQGAYILFDQPQRGITPGQFAAWYDGDELVGSGIISE